MRFKPGDKLLCVKRDRWHSKIDGKHSIGPKFNEEVTFQRYANTGSGYLVFCEYQQINRFGGQNSYNPKWFEPLVSDSALKDALEEIEVTV